MAAKGFGQWVGSESAGMARSHVNQLPPGNTPSGGRSKWLVSACVQLHSDTKTPAWRRLRPKWALPAKAEPMPPSFRVPVKMATLDQQPARNASWTTPPCSTPSSSASSKD